MACRFDSCPLRMSENNKIEIRSLPGKHDMLIETVNISLDDFEVRPEGVVELRSTETGGDKVIVELGDGQAVVERGENRLFRLLQINLRIRKKKNNGGLLESCKKD